MSLFFYLFNFAINLWHWKFITTDVTAVFVNNQQGIQRWRKDFDKKVRIWRDRQQRACQTIFLRKAGQDTVLISCWKKFQSHQRYHTTTGSFQSHPLKRTGCCVVALVALKLFPFPSKKITIPLYCLNILNILLTYTLSIHSCTHRVIKMGALKMESVCIFFNICWIIISQGSLATCLRWGG